jgi:hypothetical protein
MSDMPKLDMKQCASCRRVMPTSYFGKDRGRGDGLKRDCRPCVNLDKRISYFEKWGHAKPDKNPLITTNHRFKDHNDQIVSLGLLRQAYSCVAHHVISHNQYEVEFSMVDFLATLVLKEGGVQIAKYTDGAMDVHQFKSMILKILYEKNIRLEKTDLDLHIALREVYFI